MLATFHQQQLHHQYHPSSEIRDFKSCHTPQHFMPSPPTTHTDIINHQSPTDANNNNVFTPSPPPDQERLDGGFLGLPYHCYNYQDFPAYFNYNNNNTNEFNNQGGNSVTSVKAWRKGGPKQVVVGRKRKLPEKILRERQLRRNERERARQNRLNDAFDVLRNTIPDFLTPCKTGQKLTQIETLKLARHYIGSMRELLDSGTPIDTVIREQE